MSYMNQGRPGGPGGPGGFRGPGGPGGFRGPGGGFRGAPPPPPPRRGFGYRRGCLGCLMPVLGMLAGAGVLAVLLIGMIF